MVKKAHRNRVVLASLVLVVAGMTGLSFASVPLYRLFCQVTGFGGTTQTADAAPDAVSDRRITVRFNADIAPDLPWAFQPVQRKVTVRVGEEKLAFYEATNRSKETLTGTAVFNVTPLKAGPYFSKIHCFCFDEQQLKPGESADMPVSFFIDPEILKDPNLEDVETITLSYTFFPAFSEESAGKEAAARLAHAATEEGAGR
ncbi:MAG: cytochrome c oxidase assembly protein [Alphaproteobacteria bacterium]|nr:cytochrome c oxidase assembly protein [Alphaproteobacteria bacterium]